MLCFDDMTLQFIGEIHLWPHTMEIKKIKTQLMVKLSQGFSCKYEVSRGFCVIVEHLKDGPDSGSLSAVHSLLSAHLQDLSCGTWGLPETQGNIHGHQWFKVKHPFVCAYQSFPIWYTGGHVISIGKDYVQFSSFLALKLNIPAVWFLWNAMNFLVKFHLNVIPIRHSQRFTYNLSKFSL